MKTDKITAILVFYKILAEESLIFMRSVQMCLFFTSNMVILKTGTNAFQ